MQEEVNAIEEMTEAEMEQVSGGGVISDTIEGVCRTVSGWVGGSTLSTGVMGGLRG